MKAIAIIVLTLFVCPSAYTAIDRTQSSPEMIIYKDQIKKLVEKKRKSLQACYGKGLKQDSEITGKLVLQWDINKKGRVSRVKVRIDELKSKALRNCVVSTVRKWRFPRTPGNKNIRVAFPFRFRPRS